LKVGGGGWALTGLVEVMKRCGGEMDMTEREGERLEWREGECEY
jgi:hypothetical protein